MMHNDIVRDVVQLNIPIQMNGTAGQRSMHGAWETTAMFSIDWR